MRIFAALLLSPILAQDSNPWKPTDKASEILKELQSKHPESEGYRHGAFGYIAHACKTDETQFERTNRFLRTYADWAAKNLFEKKPEILRVVSFAKTADFQTFSGGRGSAGYYRHSERMLVNNLETGLGTAGHEMTHALMYADWSSGSPNPWFREGFAAMMENSLRRSDGTFIGIGYSHWRYVRVVRPGIERGSLPPLRELMKSGRADPNAYAVGRWICTYLYAKGLLKKFHDEFRASAGSDASGVGALEKATAKSVEDFEKEWKEWSKDLEAEISDIQGGGRFPVLGIIGRNRPEGLVAAAVAPGSAAAAAQVQVGDVVEEIDGKAVKTMAELLELISKKKEGDKVKVVFGRDGVSWSATVVLDQFIG